LTAKAAKPIFQPNAIDLLLRIWSNIISRKKPNVGRNKPTLVGVSGKGTPTELVGVMPETPVNGLIPAYCARKLFSTIS